MQTLMIFWSSWRPKTIVSERQHRLDLVLMHWYRTEPSPGTKESLRHRFFYPVLETKTFSLGFGVSVGNRCLRPLSPGVEGPFSTGVMQSTINRHYSKYNCTQCFLDAIIMLLVNFIGILCFDLNYIWPMLFICTTFSNEQLWENDEMFRVI